MLKGMDLKVGGAAAITLAESEQVGGSRGVSQLQAKESRGITVDLLPQECGHVIMEEKLMIVARLRLRQGHGELLWNEAVGTEALHEKVKGLSVALGRHHERKRPFALGQRGGHHREERFDEIGRVHTVRGEQNVRIWHPRHVLLVRPVQALHRHGVVRATTEAIACHVVTQVFQHVLVVVGEDEASRRGHPAKNEAREPDARPKLKHGLVAKQVRLAHAKLS
mmetsp:Transcript_13449/g.42890  ORF Transcript_13449/g.42890 Transcript_13449/m.42890 type:complete len:223 (+) Transcript_13449:1435-2103(+)